MPANADPSSLLVGVDVGGTFTDLVAWDGECLSVAKRPSTPPEFERAVAEAVGALEAERVRLVHGSTVATNALLENKLGRAALVTTSGFEDILELGRQNRPDLYALHIEKPRPIIPRDLCFGVGGRIDASGEILESLDESAIAPLIETIQAAGVTDVAVCFLFSFANAAHEKRVGELLAAAGFRVSLSSEVAPEFREYERASTTAATAALRPIMGRYLERLGDQLPTTVSDLRILHGGGGTTSPDEATANAGRLVLSGPAGGAAGAALVAKTAGFENAIGLDVGGTSTDVALILNGRPDTRHEHEFAGVPVRLPMLDIHTVGAGGGSIAHLDAAGGLRVGPQSAGAVPGPACYGRGGTEPTVTDANLLLGRIPSNGTFGGLSLNVAAAEQAVGDLAKHLSLDMAATAEGIVRVAEQHMALAASRVTTSRGHDPRRLPIVGFGGAGGLHACAVAELVGSDTVILPPMAGVLSALGMVAAPDAADASRTVLPLDTAGVLDGDRLYAEYGRLNAKLFSHVPPETLAAVECFADCRFKGQSHELTVFVPKPGRKTIEDAFRAAYVRTYGKASLPADRPVEVVTLRLRRVGRSPQVTLPPIEPDPSPPAQMSELAHYRRAQLIAAGTASGPFVLADVDCTAFVPAGWAAMAQSNGIIICRRKG